MKYCYCVLVLILPLFLQAQSHRLEVKPVNYAVDSLESKRLYTAYYLTNKSDDTVNISVTVSFDWCVPRHQPKRLLPGQTDSIVFDCEVRTRPFATSTFTINDDKDRYPCTLHYSLKREVFLRPVVYDTMAASETFTLVDKHSNVIPVSDSAIIPVRDSARISPEYTTSKPANDSIIAPEIQTVNNPAFDTAFIPSSTTRFSTERDSVIIRMWPDTIKELRIVRSVDEIKRNPITQRMTKRTIIQYYSNDSLARRMEIIYYHGRRKKKKGYSNFCVSTQYYSNGKIMQYIEQYNYGYSHTETSPRKDVTIVNKIWDRNGNLIFERK